MKDIVKIIKSLEEDVPEKQLRMKENNKKLDLLICCQIH